MVTKSRKSPAKNPAQSPAPILDASPAIVETREESELLFDPVGCVRVRVQRLHDHEKRWVMHGYLEAQEATEGKVAELFGGGKYRASRLVADDTGRHVVSTTTEFILPGSYKPPQSVLPGVGPQTTVTGGNEAGPATTASGERIGMNEALNMVLVNKVLDAVKASNEIVPRGPSMDWAPIIVAGLGLVKEFMARPKDDSSRDIIMLRLEEMQSRLESLSKQPGPATSAIGDAVKAIRELLDVRDMIGGESKGNDSESQMWALGIKALEAMNKDKSPSTVPTTAQPAPDTSIPMWHRMILHYRNDLLTAVSRGIEADFAADMSVRFLDPNLIGVAREFFKRSDAVSLVVRVIPQMQDYPTWLTEYVTQMRDALSDSAEVIDVDGEEEVEEVDPSES